MQGMTNQMKMREPIVKGMPAATAASAATMNENTDHDANGDAGDINSTNGNANSPTGDTATTQLNDATPPVKSINSNLYQPPPAQAQSFAQSSNTEIVKLMDNPGFSRTQFHQGHLHEFAPRIVVVGVGGGGGNAVNNMIANQLEGESIFNDFDMFYRKNKRDKHLLSVCGEAMPCLDF